MAWKGLTLFFFYFSFIQKGSFSFGEFAKLSVYGLDGIGRVNNESFSYILI